ncbi:MAG TPA: ATP-binding protein, partial [Aequorivita sp.]|nr:ATP-binding protein [Aequorivita sp.]
QRQISQRNTDNDDNVLKLQKKFRKRLNEFKDSIAENEYGVSQSEEKLKKNKVALTDWLAKAKLEKETISKQLENELEVLASKKLKASENLDTIKKGINRKISLKETEKDRKIAQLEKDSREMIAKTTASISLNRNESEQKIKDLKLKQTSELDAKGADTKRINAINDRLTEIEKLLSYIQQNEAIVIEYNKDKRELFDRAPELKTEKISLEKKQASMESEHKTELKKLSAKSQAQDKIVKSLELRIIEFDADTEKFKDFQKSDAFLNIEDSYAEPIKYGDGEPLKPAIGIISEINAKYYKGIETFKELQQTTNAFVGNFNENNIFRFNVKFNEDADYINFAIDLKEFIEEDKIQQFETRVNQRFAHIIQQIGNETGELISKEAEIEKVIKKINDDFVTKNFVQAIKEMEIRTQKSSNPIVRLLIEIKEFNDENSLLLGETNLFTTSGSDSKNQRAVELLKQLVKELERSRNSTLTLSESFDLQFKIVENDNDSGWVEKLSNVGSEGTDVLVKAMINILLLNVFKDSASKKIKDFKLHCMMDEIGRLHPTNVKGILRFANERNILLINGSPTSQNAIDYKYTYKLAKEQSRSDMKRYITKINRLVKVNPKILN